MVRTDFTQLRNGSELLKRGFARMQQGGVIMDVVDPDQAAVAEDAGAVAVMALERVPADIRRDGGVARMSHHDMIQGILDCTSIPVMAKARIGHEGEARILESMGVDMVDECSIDSCRSFFHINKNDYSIPFVCGATGLGEAVRRIHVRNLDDSHEGRSRHWKSCCRCDPRSTHRPRNTADSITR